jgi:hypothetical protein
MRIDYQSQGLILNGTWTQLPKMAPGILSRGYIQQLSCLVSLSKLFC